METKDLRIGNYVSYLGEPQEVLGMDKTQVYIKPFNFVLFLDIDEVEPIPLTEEWLLKFGFERISGNLFGIEEYLIDVNDFSFYKTPNCFDSFLLANLKHVHQLQNLYFALTNEELKLI